MARLRAPGRCGDAARGGGTARSVADGVHLRPDVDGRGGGDRVAGGWNCGRPDQDRAVRAERELRAMAMDSDADVNAEMMLDGKFVVANDIQINIEGELVEEKEPAKTTA